MRITFVTLFVLSLIISPARAAVYGGNPPTATNPGHPSGGDSATQSRSTHDYITSPWEDALLQELMRLLAEFRPASGSRARPDPRSAPQPH